MNRVFGPNLRIGVIVPPSNPAVEAELPLLLPKGAQIYVARLPVGSGGLLDRVACYNDGLVSVIESYGSLELDVIHLACTGCSYLLGPDSERIMDEKVHRVFPEMELVTAASAVRGQLTLLGISSLALVSPYPDELTSLAVKMWTDWGFHIDAVHKLVTQSIYDARVEDVIRVTREVKPVEGSAVLISGTGVPTVASYRMLEGELKVPVLSSTICAGRVLATMAVERGRALAPTAKGNEVWG